MVETRPPSRALAEEGQQKSFAKTTSIRPHPSETTRRQAKHCKRWANVLNHVCEDLGEIIIDSKRDITARVLRFPRGFSIYSLSSNPNALVGRAGHIKIDEFAVHQDQRELYSIASPCINWGGQLSIISTHRGVDTTFNQIIRSIREEGNPMDWSHHRITIHDAVEQGIVERINAATRRSESRGAFINRLRSQCLDEEQWLREYCCQPMDTNSAFLTWEMITSCETPNCLKPFSYLSGRADDSAADPGYHPSHPSHWSRSSDFSDSHALPVSRSLFYVGEKIGDVLWDRMRIELHNKKFSEIEEELFAILRLPCVIRCCIDATGIGMQLAERAKDRFGSRVEPIHFTAAIKEELAFALRNAFEDRKLRIDPDPKLRDDLRGVKKLVTSAGNIRFLADNDDSHCDRFWAKALRQHAAQSKGPKWVPWSFTIIGTPAGPPLYQHRRYHLNPLPLLAMNPGPLSLSPAHANRDEKPRRGKALPHAPKIACAESRGRAYWLRPMRGEILKDVTRIVVKLGTGVLTDARKQLDAGQVEQLVAQVAAQRQTGKELVLVTSGAVGAGMGALGFERRPVALADLQACAAVGQTRLMATYETLFAKFNLRVAQVLLTHDDLEDHERHLNARNTLVALLQRGVVPIINENDAVSFTELKFGDNDKLSALVASLLPADLLVILTTVDGVIQNFGKPDPKTIPLIEAIDERIETLAGGTSSATAVGGMASKIQAAKIVMRAGIPLVIASGKKKSVLARIVQGEEEGTLFVPQTNKLKGRKRWIAFFHHPKGSLVVDDGARRALREGGKSLLPPGIARVEGGFENGDIVRICDLNGTEFARGIVRFGSKELGSTESRPTKVEVVHRDDLVIL